MLFLNLLLLLISGQAKEHVVTLTKANFEEVVKKSGKILVEFYAPWCGHCKSLAPHYEGAAKKLVEDGIDFVLAKVDATAEDDLAKKYGVQGFPTIKYFSNGDLEKPSDYQGGRTKDAILSWIDVRTKPATTVLADEKAFKEFISQGNSPVVAFIVSDDHHKEVGKFAEDNREKVGQVGLIKDGKLIESLKEKEGTVKVYPKFNKYEPITFAGDKLDAASLTTFANAERFPLFAAIGPDNYKDYMERALPLVWISIEENADIIKTTTAIIEPIAETFKGELSFVWIDNKKYEQHVKNLGITGNPGLMVLGDPDKFLYTGEWTKEGLSSWFNDYRGGKLKPHLKSQPKPEKQDEDVYVLVGSEFKNVIDGKKNVFVEFYAPWCGHCKKLAPEYEKVAQEFKSNNNVVIAKIDATENDTPEPIQGFPTLIFYPKGETKGIPFEGDRTSEAMIKFLKEKVVAEKSEL